MKVHKITCAVQKIKATFTEIHFTELVSLLRQAQLLVDYEGVLIPCVVTAFNDNGSIRVKCLSKAHGPRGSTWKWPGRVDEHDYLARDIRKPVEVPKLISGSRNIVFHVPELNSLWGE